jgi:2-C-methyl-D-erythritol 2,4-cyclodiphosphate synthase
VPGDPSNLKVTLPADLAQVSQALERGSARRTGIGHDSHPFGPGEPLALGGIRIAGAPRLYGHSDGDVALHAVCDAILGAAGLGDLGRLFPAGPSTPAGVESAALLADVVERAAAAGWRVAALDLTIVAARPRLGAHLDAMRAAIATLAAVEPGAVNVKASTGNLDGSDGAGRTVSALALATLVADAREPAS